MKKLFTKRLFFYMLTALVLTIAAIFILQTVVSQKSNDSASRNKLEDVKEKLASNASNIERLTENLSKDNLAKTRAFADMLAQDPSIVGDLDKLKKITERLMVNELHVIDEDGIIISSNFEDYVGFDMKSGEQSNAFMVIVEDPSIEIVQEPQVNASKGIVMQYIGVARTDAKGVVQVGVHPEVLEEMLVGTEISTVLKDMDFGTEGYIYAIDAKSGQILAHRNAELIDTPATDAGFPANYTGKGRAVVDGVKGYYVAEEYDGQIIGTFLPSSEYYAGRSSQTLVVSLSMLLIFGVLLLMINRMVDEKIVQGINQISNSMSEIAAGNFEIVIDEHGNPEFTMLSNNINKMVESICQSINQNERLIEQQKQDMEQNNSVTMAINVTAATENTSEKIAETQSRMRLLTNSMQKISEMSIKIEKIIGEINSIAHQTNMLSLNASIEAARAGDLGKGFAVVATQVGELAARSAQAAKETNDLIMNSSQAVESGQEITDQTVEAFDIVVEDIRKTDHDVKEITEMVRQNVSIVSNAVSQIERISGVVEGNVQISQDTKQVSSHMANITEKLLNIVE